MYSIYITAQHTGPDQTSSQTPAPDQHTISASQHDQASGYSTAQHAANPRRTRSDQLSYHTSTVIARYVTDNIYD